MKILAHRNAIGRVFVAVLVIVIVALAGMGYVLYQQTAISPENVKLVLDVSPGPSHAPYYYGVSQNIYKDDGINLTILAGTTVSAGLAALEAGSVDFAVADPSNLVLFSANNNATDLKMVALTYQRAFAAVVYNNASIRTPADLNGKTGMMANPATSSLSSVFKLFVSANNLNLSSMKITYASGSTPGSYLLEGKVQFIVTTVQNLPNYNSLGASSGLKFGAFDVASYGVSMVGFAVVTTDKMIQEHPDTVRNFVKATLQSFTEAYSSQAEAVSSLVRFNPQLNESAALAGFRLDTRCCALNPSSVANPLQYGWMDPQLMQQTVNNVRSALGVKASINASSIYTNEFTQSP